MSNTSLSEIILKAHDEYQKNKDLKVTRLHLDHVPVINEDGLRVDYERIIKQAIDMGYDSVMVDGSLCRRIFPA